MKAFVVRVLSLALLGLCLLFACAACGGAQEQTPPAAQKADAPLKVYISEVQSSNKSTLALPDGSFPDWVELCNAGEETAQLEGCRLVCGGEEWTFPALTLEPGAYTLLWCDGREAEKGHACFSIAKEGEALSLFAPDGRELDALVLPALESDSSFCSGGSVSLLPTPGFSNDEAGYEAFQSGRAAAELAIGEVMVYNEWFLPQTVSGETVYFDWVEISNFSAQALRLSDYYLSDKQKNRLLYRLPDAVLAPGESRVILCSEEYGGGECAPFDLSSAGETLYLSRADGALCDYVCLRELPLGTSLGRESGQGGFFHYASPSPGEVNRGGFRLIAERPRALSPDGVFEGVKSVTVELAGEGAIRYTLDGSLPTADSPLYTDPLVFTQTAVLRAVSFREGCLPSEPLTLSYIVNEGHSLPVVSLVCDPEDLFGLKEGIYSNPTERWEKQGEVMFFGEGESFRLACGVKLHGATSRTEMAKKSFKLCFRDRYDGRLNFDLFNNGVREFQSILLRADQESEESTQIRDALMHALAAEAFPELPVQDHRYAVLYLNGEYWGVYTLREAHSDAHYAAHYGYDEDTVSQWKEAWPLDSLSEEVWQYALSHDLSKDEYYAYVAEHVNADSVIGWCVMQVYSGNIDFNSPNMRFYYSTQDEQLRFALVDLDLGMYTRTGFAELFGFGYMYTALAKEMMANTSFRQELLRQLSDALQGPLSDEHVLETIDRFAAELEPEMARDHARWTGSLDSWKYMVEELRSYIRGYDGQAENLVNMLTVSGLFLFDEIRAYFPDAKYMRAEW